MSRKATVEEAAGDMLAAALDYAARGWPVFPVSGKTPLTERGFKDASTDPERARAWWSAHPDAGVGVPTGEPSGLFVIDVDAQKGGARTWKALVDRHGNVPKTAATLTGGGGSHILFLHPGNVASSAGKFCEHVDVRGDGGYIVLPPSTHPNGRPYKWLYAPDKTGIAEPPAWLVALARGRPNGPAPKVDEIIPEGRRRAAMLTVAGKLKRAGLTGEEILPTLRELNKRCRPPLGARELESVTKNTFPAAYRTGVAGNESPGDQLSFTLLAPLLENVPPEPSWVVSGYLAPGAITLLAGRPKVGKSTLAFALLAAVAVGAPFVGLGTAPGGVLLLTEERRDTIAEKARALGLIRFRQSVSPIGTGNESVHVLLRHDAGDTDWPEVVRQAMAYCAQHKVTVLVVDTFDRWTGLRGDAENAAGAVNAALEPLQYAAAAGLAVLLLSHQRKSSGEYGEAVRGSSALTGGVDVVVELERPSRVLQLGGQARVLKAVSRFSSTPKSSTWSSGSTTSSRSKAPSR